MSTFTAPVAQAGGAGWTGWTHYHPLGVAGIISPWNFPMNVMCRKALPALLTGNTVVFKPAPYTPWSAVYMASLFESAGFPPGVFNCVTGQSAALGEALVDHHKVRAISFTGSTAVGKIIQQQAAGRLVRTQLELGGKSALIVMEDADLDAACDAIMTAGFACAGQWCTSTSRVLLQKGIAADFINQLTKRCEDLTVGHPMDNHTKMGPVAGAIQYEKIIAHINNADAQGAQRLTGGAVTGDLAKQGYYIRPTLFSHVTPEMSLFREEVFGPVLATTVFNTLDEAIDIANCSDYALSSGIFTRDLKQAHRYIDAIEAGLAHVNIHTGFKDPSLPFGGWKDSGYGPPENSRTGLEFFVELKAVYMNH
jgi:aldehyde dehydrogenase (NAD+)